MELSFQRLTQHPCYGVPLVLWEELVRNRRGGEIIANQGLDPSATLYMLAKQLSQVLSLSPVLHRSALPDTPEAKRIREIAPAEVVFVVIIIIVLKMVYGLDGKERQVMSGWRRKIK